MRTPLLGSLPLFPLLLLLADATAGQGNGRTETGWGLSTTTFDTLHGRVHVILPDDARPGDTLSGTVSVEPAGRDDKQRKAASDRLQGHVLEVPGGKVPLSAGTLRLTVPAAAGIALRLADARGRGVGRALVPVSPAPAATAGTASGTAGLEVPPVAQAGRPVSLTGPFDGDLANARVSVGGQPAEVLAESPRRLVARVPADVVGPAELTVEEAGTTSRGELRVLAVTLSAGKLDLEPGRSTALTVEVRGLAGLDQPVPLTIVNRSRSRVALADGDEQLLTIAPEDVGPDGGYTWTRTLTGRAPGGFEISAYVPSLFAPRGPVAQPAPPPAGCPCQELKLEDRTSPWIASRIDVEEWKEGGEVRGLRLNFSRSFQHYLTCAAGQGECREAVHWSVEGVRVALEGVRIEGEDGAIQLLSGAADPRQALTAEVEQVAYLHGERQGPDLIVKAACGGKSSQQVNAHLRLRVSLSSWVLDHVRAGRSVVFSAVRAESRWKAGGCGGRGESFADPAGRPHQRRTERLSFSGWK